MYYCTYATDCVWNIQFLESPHHLFITFVPFYSNWYAPMAWLDDPIFAENKNRQDKNFILPSCVLWGPGWAFPRSEFQNPLFDILRRKKCPHWHFTIFFFALVFIALQFQPIFVLFVAISLFYYVTISRPCHMSEFCLNRVVICIVHLTCYRQWQIQGKDPGGSPHNLIFKIISIFFLILGPPLSQGLDDHTTPPILIWRSGLAS